MEKNSETNTKPAVKKPLAVKDLRPSAERDKSVKGGALTPSFNVTNF